MKRKYYILCENPETQIRFFFKAENIEKCKNKLFELGENPLKYVCRYYPRKMWMGKVIEI